MAEVKPHENPALERGDIYFLYRPKVDREHVQGADDVARVYILLKPRKPRLYRLMIVGRKKLPDPEEHDRFWCFVYRVFRDREALNAELGEEVYATKTRGERRVPPARPAAEGVYALVRHEDHTHLAYVLELPKTQGPVERDLNIKREASYVISVRNPEAPGPPVAGLDPAKRARFPPELQARFKGRRFIPVDPPDFMNHEGAELLLIGAAPDPEKELDLEFRPDAEDEHTADVLRDLKLPSEVVREPLFEGRWA